MEEQDQQGKVTWKLLVVKAKLKKDQEAGSPVFERTAAFLSGFLRIPTLLTRISLLLDRKYIA